MSGGPGLEQVSPGELALMIAAAGSDAPELAAEAEVVRRFSRGVTLMLRHLLGDWAAADDLHQETFGLVIEKLRAGEIREPERLAGFIRGIARYLVLAEHRRRGRARDQLDLDAAGEVADVGVDPLEQMLIDEDRRLVRRLLAELGSERDREVLRRLHLAGESRDQVCAALGLGRAQLNLVVFRARQRFRRLVEERAGGGARVRVKELARSDHLGDEG